MEKFNAIEKTWINSFESSDPSRILRTLYEVRNSGSVNILPELFSVLHKNTDPQVRNEIINLISEIKSAEAVPVIAESLSKHDYGDYLDALVAACWQSGLDFSKHLRVFAGLFVQANYNTALEAFTVIEESLVNASDADINGCLLFLKESECLVSDEKLPLFRELKKVVESY